MISIDRGPEPGLETMPRVNTEDPAISKAEPRVSPLDHHMINPKPTTMEASHTTNRMIMATGPTNAMTRSRTSYVGRGGRTRRVALPRARATARMARDDVARGTTSAVKRLTTVEPRTSTPTISATTRRNVSITSSCHVEIAQEEEAQPPRLRC